jgi:hypothetical protein
MFVRACAPAFVAWAVAGTFSALLPSFVSELLATKNAALAASALTLMIGVSALTQLLCRSWTARSSQIIGLGSLSIGLCFFIAATVAPNASLTVLALLASGCGHGLIFAGQMDDVMKATTTVDRGAVLGAVYLVGYVGLGGPVLAVGLTSLSHGLLGATYGAAIAALVCCLALLLVVGLAGPHEDH